MYIFLQCCGSVFQSGSGFRNLMTREAFSHHKRLSNISKHKYKLFSFFGSFLPSWTGSGSIRPKSIWIHGDLEQDCQHRIFVLSSMKQMFFGSPIVIMGTSQPASTYLLNKENTPPPPPVDREPGEDYSY
jgi:hypothetical protein